MNPRINVDLPTTFHKSLVRFWGKPLSNLDLEVCKTFGWVTSKTRGRSTEWRLKSCLRSFRGCIHTDHGVTPYSCDDALAEYVEDFAISNVDREGAKLCRLLFIINLELAHCATHTIHEGELCFRSTSAFRKNLTREGVEALTADARRGSVVCNVIDGNPYVYWVTPAGLFADGDDAGLTDGMKLICRKLSQSGLLESHQTERELVWRPTPEGKEKGLHDTTMPAADLLISLGLRTLVERECADDASMLAAQELAD